MSAHQRATKVQMENLARLLREFCLRAMASDDPALRTPAHIAVYVRILKDAKIRAMAAAPALDNGRIQHDDAPFRPFRLRDEEEE